MRAPFDPYGAASPAIDQQLGDAFQVVRFVARHIPEIASVAYHMEGLYKLVSAGGKANADLMGLPAEATNLGEFDGTILLDDSTVKSSLQLIATYVEDLKDSVDDQFGDQGIFAGSTIPDNAALHAVLQALETAIEALPTQKQVVNQITPEMFGCVADFDGTVGTDNTAKMILAINAASAAKATLVLTGQYFCASSIVLVNKHIDWNGSVGSGLVFNASDGVVISQNDYTYATQIENLSFYTIGKEAGIGLSVSYTASDSINNRNLPRCFLNKLTIRGWDFLNQGWSKGVYTKNVHAACIGTLWVVGRRDLGAASNRASFGNMVCGFEYDSDLDHTAIPSDAILKTVHVYNAQQAILLTGEVEGMSITGCKLVGVWSGIVSNMATARPGLQVYGNHVNFFDYGVDLYRQPQSQVFNNLFYKFELSDGLSVSVRVRSCDFTYIGQNTHINSCTDAAVSGEFNGVVITDSVDCLVDSQIAANLSRIVSLTGGTTRCRVKAQTFTGTSLYTNSTVNNAVVDTTGGVNFIGNRWASAKGAALTLDNTGMELLSLSTPVNVRAGQRFRLDAVLAFTKDVIGGNINFSVGKSAGSASVVFYLDAASFGATTNAEGNTQSSLVASCEMTVISDGDLQLTMSGISAGSNAAIAAGGAQITMTELG